MYINLHCCNTCHTIDVQEKCIGFKCFIPNWYCNNARSFLKLCIGDQRAVMDQMRNHRVILTGQRSTLNTVYQRHAQL